VHPMRQLALGAVVVLLAFGISLLLRPSRFEPELRRFEALDRQSPPEPGAVLFVGSSSIKMWRSLESDFRPLRVLRRGLGSAGVEDMTRFADRIVIPYRPRRVVFYGGDNDLAYGRTPWQVLTDFAAFVKRVRRDLPGVEITFLAIKPSPARTALLPKIREANGLVRSFTQEHEGLSYIDVYTPMLDAQGVPRRELYKPDGLHLSDAGYDLWAEVVGRGLGQEAEHRTEARESRR
jgi:hypothetical protein